MEIAGNYAVSVAPPAFQLATEEAKRDTKLREQIPEPKPAERAAAQSRSADERGGAMSASSTLAAQNAAQVESGRRSLTELSAQKRRDDEKGAGKGTAKLNAADAPAPRTPSVTPKDAASTAPRSSLTAASTPAAASTALAQFAALDRASAVPSGNAASSQARYRKSSDEADNSAGAVIARRYNQTTALQRRGTQLDLSV